MSVHIIHFYDISSDSVRMDEAKAFDTPFFFGTGPPAGMLHSVLPLLSMSTSGQQTSGQLIWPTAFLLASQTSQLTLSARLDRIPLINNLGYSYAILTPLHEIFIKTCF